MEAPPFVTQGYFLDYQAPISHRFAHHFCGPQAITGAWCPNCEKRLLRFFSLDTRDPRLKMQHSGIPFLHLLFCWTCNVAQNPFLYQLSADGSVSLLHYGEGGVDPDFPYDDYPTHFSGSAVELVPLTDEEQQCLQQINSHSFIHRETELGDRLAVPMHQIGGEPFFVQDDGGSRLCPSCQQQMPFLASVGDSCLHTEGFTGNAYVQVLYHYCPACHIVHVIQTCD